MNDRENWLRVVEFRGPERIPCGVGFSPLTWQVHRERLEEVCLQHPKLFPGFVAGGRDFDSFPPFHREGLHETDNWGCVWYNTIGGLEGQCIGHPLADWNALETYQPPDVMTKTERGDQDWNAVRQSVEAQRAAGGLISGSGERLFDRLYFLRGFENLMMDFATDDPHLPRMIQMLEDYELSLVEQWLALGVDVMGFHTDIGTQKALMISPAKFRKYVKPMFKTVFSRCRDGGAHVYLSSDGCLLEIVDDLIECGVSVHDPQMRANGLDGIERAYKGKLCANVDLDRQMFAFCSPADIDRHVGEVVERLNSPEGGLMVSASVWDDNTPIENIEAICASIERHCLGA